VSRTATGWQATGERCGTCKQGFVLARVVFTYAAQVDYPVREDRETQCSVADCLSNYTR
jgi:hypothetical protein